MSSTATPVADLTKADLGTTISITRDGVTVIGPLTRIEHEARLVNDKTFADSEARYIVTGVYTILYIYDHRFRFGPSSGVEFESAATIEVLS